MSSQIDALLGYALSVWRHRARALLAAALTILAGWVILLVIPDRYEATASVYVDAQTALRPMLRGIAVDDDSTSSVTLVREALLSRPKLQSVLRTTGLDRGGLSQDDIERQISTLQRDIKVTATSGASGRSQQKDNLYTISYQASNRDTSIAVVRALLDNFVEGALSGSRTGAEDAQRFLVEQIAAYETRLAAAEARLAEFKKKNVGMVPGQRGDYFARLESEMTALQQAQTSLAIAQGKREELRRQLSALQPFVPGTSIASAGGGTSSSDLSIRIQESQARLEQLLLSFTDRHPEVLALRQTISELKKRESDEMADLSRGGKGSGAIRSLTANPVYQSVQMQLSQSDVEIASLRGAISQHGNEISSLKRFVDSAPEVERELARLNRDYGVTKAQYEALVQRLEQAKVSDGAAQSGIIRFDVIEPPRADRKPVSPDRRILGSLFLALSLFVGVAVACLPHFLNPTFHSPESLMRAVDVHLLGSVSLAKQPSADRVATFQGGATAVIFMAILAFGVAMPLLGDACAAYVRAKVLGAV